MRTKSIHAKTGTHTKSTRTKSFIRTKTTRTNIRHSKQNSPVQKVSFAQNAHAQKRHTHKSFMRTKCTRTKVSFAQNSHAQISFRQKAACAQISFRQKLTARAQNASRQKIHLRALINLKIRGMRTKCIHTKK